MSVLIKGMKMPTRCEDCPVCHYMERGTITACGCKATMMIRPIDCNSKPYWCPLAEVQTPHGRLIDADALDINRREEQAWHDYEQNQDNEYLEGVKDGLHEAAKQLSIAPAIIPAERSE